MSEQDKQAAQHQHTDGELAVLSTAVARGAGFEAMGFARRESIEMDVKELMEVLVEEVHDAGESDGGTEEKEATLTVKEVAGAVCRYLSNVEKDIHNARYRNISTGNAFFQRHIAPFPSAGKLLGLVGFKPSGGSLIVKHRNVAPMCTVREVVEQWLSPAASLQRQRAQLAKQAKAAAEAKALAVHAEQQKSAAEREDEEEDEEEEVQEVEVAAARGDAEGGAAAGECAVRVRVTKGGMAPARERTASTTFSSADTTLGAVLAWARSEPSLASAVAARARVVLQSPNLPGRPISVDEPDGGGGFEAGKGGGIFATTLAELGVGTSAAVRIVPVPENSSGSGMKALQSEERTEKQKRSQNGGKIHTMLSTGVLKANTGKYREVEQADGTVLVMGDEDEDEDEDEEEDEQSSMEAKQRESMEDEDEDDQVQEDYDEEEDDEEDADDEDTDEEDEDEDDSDDEDEEDEDDSDDDTDDSDEEYSYDDDDED